MDRQCAFRRCVTQGELIRATDHDADNDNEEAEDWKDEPEYREWHAEIGRDGDQNTEHDKYMFTLHIPIITHSGSDDDDEFAPDLLRMALEISR